MVLRGIVKQSAGHIRIYSEEGHGTTIRMYTAGHQRSAGVRGPPCSGPVRAASEPFLVVEDDKLV